MSDKVRVRNVTPYDIGLKTQTGLEYNIRPHAFIMLERDDVEYCYAIAPTLFTGVPQLIVEDEQVNEFMNIDPTAVEACDEATAEKYLRGSAKSLKAWLEDHNEPHILETVAMAAEKMDLSASKIKILQEFLPNRDFV